MNCPDCDFESMECEDQSGVEYNLAGTVGAKPKEKKYVSARYFCQNCKQYWRWQMVGGLSRA